MLPRLHKTKGTTILLIQNGNFYVYLEYMQLQSKDSKAFSSKNLALNLLT